MPDGRRQPPLEPIASIRERLSAVQGSELARLIQQHSSDPRASVRALLDASRRRLERERVESDRLEALYALESTLRREGAQLVVGVDEVGRGALAGPVTAAACALPERPFIRGLDDSKRLAPARRREVAERIRSVAHCFAVVHVPPEIIDRDGIGVALRRAMREALERLPITPDCVLVDGRPIGVHPEELAIVGGDASVASIAAASVLAKVSRDELMENLAERYPGYDLATNKGYGTAEHLRAIASLGLSDVHRRSFCARATAPRIF